MTKDKHGPAGIAVDLLHEIRKAMRALRRAERRAKADIRAERKRAERALAPAPGRADSWSK